MAAGGPARLQVGSVVPYLSQSSQGILVPNAPIVNSVNYQQTGVIMEVTPRVNSGGLVTLDVMQDVSSVKQGVVKTILTVQVRSQQDVAAVEEAPALSNVRYQHADYPEALASDSDDAPGAGAVAVAAPPVAAALAAAPPFTRAGQKVGRNDPCPCGSGKKYKQCHGKLG